MDNDYVDVLGISQGRHAADFILERFQDVIRTFLKDWKNME